MFVCQCAQQAQTEKTEDLAGPFNVAHRMREKETLTVKENDNIILLSQHKGHDPESICNK